MCILCLASRWSRRIVTLLPWLIIPLVILWALSQLLPSEFQFEVTSPRLACVGVLLVSLGWYELAMPRVTTWRAKRSAYLKERRRLEVQEAAKWRKEATRLCRNCSSPYRDQTPACGKFVCTFCGHMSRRPVLDVPPSTVYAGIKAPSVVSAQSLPCGGYTCNMRGNHSVDTGRGPWLCRIWPKCMKFSVFGASFAWMVGRGAPRGSSSSIRASYGFPLCSQWGAEHTTGNLTRWFGEGNNKGDFSIFFLVLRVLFIILICLKWIGQKVCGGDTDREETLAGGRSGAEHKEDADNRKGSRGEKARRKAEEKRLARLAREQMEADERRQREEVARLVEERRRLRDEKVEAERVNDSEIPAERYKELHQEGEVERRRQERLKKRELIKDRPGTRDAGEDGEKDRKKRYCKLKGTQDQKPNDGGKKLDATRTISTAKESAISDLCNRGTNTKMAVSLKAGRFSRTQAFDTNSKMQNTIFSATRDTSPVAAANPAKMSRSIGNAGANDTKTLCTNKVAPSVQRLNTGYSAWKNMRWSNVWGKAASTTPSEVCATSPDLPSNFDLQRAACSDFLDKGDWFGGVHARGDSQRVLNNISDLASQDQKADMITRVDPGNHVAPIGPQQAVHAETFGTHSGKHGSAMISEPWVDDFNLRRQLDLDLRVLKGEAAAEDGNWKMWEAPQLDQIQIPCIKDSSADPLAWMRPLGLSSEVAGPNRVGVSRQLETYLSDCYSSPQPDYSDSSCPVSLSTMSTSLWSSAPFFSPTNLQRGFGVVGPFTQGMMDEPITLGDDIFYAHSPVLSELQTYNTSLNPGECFTSFPDREVVIDRPLRSNQSVAGMQRRSAMHRETLDLEESRSKWSAGIASADWSTSMATTKKSSDFHYGGFYSAPSAPSLWSINAT